MAENRRKESSPPLLLLPTEMQLPTFVGSNILMSAAPAEPTVFPITRSGNSEETSQTDNFLGQLTLPNTFADKANLSSNEGADNANRTQPTVYSSPTHTSILPPTNVIRESSPSTNRLMGRPQYVPPPGFTATSSVHHEISSSNATAAPPPFSSGFIASPSVSQTMQPLPSQKPPPGPSQTFTPSIQQTAVASGQPAGFYIPVQHHWFYSKMVEQRFLWLPMSMVDSLKLEDAFQEGSVEIDLSTDGGRYDVNIARRSRSAIYWEEEPSYVRRCSWFYKPEAENRFVPYDEDFSVVLENEYHATMVNNTWHRRIELANGEAIVIHSPTIIVHFVPSQQPDEFGTVQSSPVLRPTDQARPRVVKRGVSDFDDILEGEPVQIDHVVFVVHGIGSTCDLRFRNIVECVDDFRAMSLKMLQSHFKTHQEQGSIGRVEFLPVRWHNALHEDASGVDSQLKSITLPSIGRLRHFTNDTLLDILFYASPTYAQKIADTVGSEINRLFSLFTARNAQFAGGISLAGHSLGSLILFDMLAHQADDDVDTKHVSLSPMKTITKTASLPVILQAEPNGNEAECSLQTIDELLGSLNLTDYVELFRKEQITDVDTLLMCSEGDIKEMGLPLGPRKKILSLVQELQDKKAKSAEASMLAAAAIGADVHTQSLRDVTHHTDLQQARDPLLHEAASASVDYVLSAAGTGLPYVKYPKLHFSVSSFFALGSPIAMFLAVRGVKELGEEFRFPTCPAFYNVFHPFDPVAYRIEPLLTVHYPAKPVLMPHHKGRKRLHLELRDTMSRMGLDLKQKLTDYIRSTWRTISDFAYAHKSSDQEVDSEVDSVMSQMAADSNIDDTASITSQGEEEGRVGSLNQGRRVDYVLQEKPIESFNDYLFALGSHACYWESEDTVLMLLREIYAPYGINAVMPGQQDVAPVPPSPQHSTFPYSSGSSAPHAYSAPPLSYASGTGQFTPYTSSGYAAAPVVGAYGHTGAGQGPASLYTPQTAAAYPQHQQRPTVTGPAPPPPLTGFVPKNK